MAGYDASPITGAQAKAAIEKTRAQAVHVQEYGAVGDGTTDDTAAIQSAVDAVPNNGVLELEPGKTYYCENVIDCGSKTMTVVGNGSAIKRGDAQHTTTSSSTAVNSTNIEVSDIDALGVAVGDFIVLLDATSANGGRADGEQSSSGRLEITGISGSTITVGETIDSSDSLGGSDFPSGSIVLKVYRQLSHSENGALSLRNVVFDGNRDNNEVHNGWTVNQCVTRISDGAVVEGCIFHDVPNECMFLGFWATVTNCSAYNLNGSFTHTSSATSQSEDPSGMNLLMGNRVSRAGEIGPDISSHSEAVFTFSANSGKVIICDNIVENCTQGFAGRVGNTGEVVISGNFVKNTNGAFHTDERDVYIPTIKIADNVFDTCLWALIGDVSSRVYEDEAWEGILVSGNQFVNTQVSMLECSGINISNNTFLWEDDFDPSAVTPKYDVGAALLRMFKVVSGVISGNVFEDQQSSVNGITHAIEWVAASALKSNSSTSTDYLYYGRNMVISGNSISNTSNGIYYPKAQDAGYTDSVINFVVQGNQITLRDDSSSEYGIRGYPGMSIIGNSIVCSSNTDAGIMCVGVNSSKKDDINSEVCIGNVVMGNPSRSIRAGSGDNTQGEIDKSWNMTIANNVTQVAIVEDNPSQNTFANNVQVPLTSQAFEYQPSRANPAWY